VDDGAAGALWIHDLERPGRRRLQLGPEAVTAAAGGFRVLAGFWSPKGDIYYSLALPNLSRSQLFVKPNNGFAPATPVSVPITGTGIRIALDASAEDRYLLLAANTDPRQAPRIWTLREGTVTQFSNDSEQAFSGTLSPNDRYLAYVSRIDTRNEIYVRDFPDGPGIWQVSMRGGSAPLWAPDGAELFFNERGTLMRVPVSTRSGQFTAGSPEPLFEHPTLAGNGGPFARYGISRDGKKFLTVEAEYEFPQPFVRVVENWLSEFRRTSHQTTR
jgi:Tol biopolymer transport system component